MSRGIRVVAMGFVAALFAFVMCAPSFAHEGEQHPSPATTLGPENKPPGERNPIVGAIAIATIVGAGVAGIYIYRVIRKGL